LEAAGLSYQIGVEESNILSPLREAPAEYVAAVIEAEEMAKTDDMPRSVAHVRKAVDRRRGFADLARNSNDLTWDEYDGLKTLTGPRFWGDFVSVADCRKRKAVPRDESLLKVARGEQLAALVKQLKPIGEAAAQLAKAKEGLKELSASIADKRKSINAQMKVAKRDLEPGKEQPEHRALYDLSCKGKMFSDTESLPEPGASMDEVIAFLKDLDAIRTEDAPVDWAIVITPHAATEDDADTNSDEEDDEDVNSDENDDEDADE
jgi:DNA-binding phage protein